MQNQGLVRAFLLLLIASVVPRASVAQNSTPKYWKCNHRVSGSWEFGQAPQACDANSFGTDATVIERYGKLIYRDASAGPEETDRYIDELHAVIREAAGRYLLRRKPRASPVEVLLFRRAVFALAHQESYWTHYRRGEDGRLKLMRGDGGHGHGLMQIDDRWHFVKVNRGEAWDLIENMTHALEIYYAEWERATKAPCVKRQDDFIARARSAYSAYNGGPAQLCRWIKTGNRWARNDQGFHAKLRDEAWESHVVDPNRAASVQVACALEGGGSCSLPAASPKLTGENDFFLGEKNGVAIGVCHDKDGRIDCVSSEKDLVCLRALGIETAGRIVERTGRVVPSSTLVHDRHRLCADLDPELFAVGDRIEAQRPVVLRDSPGQGWLRNLTEGEVVEVLDFAVKNGDSLARDYEVRTSDGARGWVAGGVLGTQHEFWLRSSAGVSDPLVPEGIVRVQPEKGLNVRLVPDGRKIGTFAAGAEVRVRSHQVRGAGNTLFLDVVSLDGRLGGWIYAGRLSPKSTVAEWVRTPQETAR